MTTTLTGVIIMDDYGNDTNKTLKIIFGLLIGLLAIMLIIPLAANVIATQVVADAANEALNDLETDTSVPSSAGTVLPAATETSTNDNTQEHDDVTPVDTDEMYIRSGTITTGSSLSSKSTCKVFVGKEFSGAKVQISTLYSRDGTDLNAGKLVPKTVDSDGYITVNSADAFKLYPDSCLICLYDSNGNELDYRTVYLETESGTQSFQ